ncbi:MAG: isoprenylcysteine carboxylmethyltransferase family protein [Pseudoruegeria sp.]
MKRIDIPPVWLAAFLYVAWSLSNAFPALSFGGGWAEFLAGILIGSGIVLLLLAIVEFRKHKTTFIPHETATALIQSGIFKRSRNPIYLGDMLILAGGILWWDAVVALPLVPIFLWVIEKRFVIPEENKLRRQFRVQFAAYCAKTRRWI